MAQRIFKHRQRAVIRDLYQNLGWCRARLDHLLYLFINSANLQEQDLAEELAKPMSERRELAGEPQYQELLRLLEEEIASVQEEFQYAEKLNQEKAAIERDACLAPEGEQWKMMLRREETLDRSIDRKLKILLGLRKQSPAPPVSTGDQGDGEEIENVDCIPAVRIPAPAVAKPGASLAHAPIPEIAEQGGSSAATRHAKIDEASVKVVENQGSPRPVGAGLAPGFPDGQLMPALRAASPPRLAESLRSCERFDSLSS